MYQHRDNTDVFSTPIAVAAERAGVNLAGKAHERIVGEIKRSGLARFIARRGWKLDLTRAQTVRITDLDTTVAGMLENTPTTPRVVDLTQPDQPTKLDFSTLGSDEPDASVESPYSREPETATDDEELVTALDRVEGRDLADSLARYFFERFEVLVKREEDSTAVTTEAYQRLQSEFDNARTSWEATAADYRQQMEDLTAARDNAVRERQEAMAEKDRLELQVGQLMRDMGSADSSDAVTAAARKFLPKGFGLR
jgi:hypothetical protein